MDNNQNATQKDNCETEGLENICMCETNEQKKGNIYQNVTGIYSCGICTFMTSSTEEMRDHKKKEHDVVWPTEEYTRKLKKNMHMHDAYSQTEKVVKRQNRF